MDDDLAPILTPGNVLAGIYRIRELIGGGAMGQVYEAEDVVLKRRVAIKIALPIAVAAGASLRAEAQALAAVRHPSMVSVYAFGQHDGLEFMVMERVHGITLEAHIEERHASGQTFTVEEAVDLLIAIADGLAAVHRAGISHRDFKPANVMLTPQSRTVLMDFGLFRPAYQGQDPGLVGGTPAYMAPEVVFNVVDPTRGHLADLYALGITAFELLAGELPFDAPTIQGLLVKQVTDAVPSLSEKRRDVPEALSDLVAALMSKEPDQRPQDTDMVLWQLRDLLSRRGLRPRHARALRVLVVDDAPFAREALRLGINEGMPSASVAFAKNGQEALNYLRTETPDVILMDLVMPGMNGIEVSMHIRSSRAGQRIRIVSISGVAEHDDIALMNQLGITHFIPKGRAFTERVVAILQAFERDLSY